MEYPIGTQFKSGGKFPRLCTVTDTFAAKIPSMDALDRECAEKMLSLMLATRDDARKWEITVTARASRAKAA